MGNYSGLKACIGDEEFSNQYKKQSLQGLPPPEGYDQDTGLNQNEDHEEEGIGSSYENSIRNSFYKSKEIGPYLKIDKSNSYNTKIKSWKQAIEQTPIHGWKEFGDQLEIDFKEKYQYCCNKLDKALISFYIMNRKHFLQLIQEGPPNNRIRWSCWKLLLIKTKKQISYETCKESSMEDHIIKDVKRTLTQHPFFKSQDNGYTIGHQALLHVLNSIAYLLPQLGYCQGMNFIAGFFLLISGGDENLSFQCMVSLLTSHKYLMYYMFDDKLELLHFMEFMTEKQIKQQLPQIAKHFYNIIEFPNSFWLTKMIITIFLYNFKLDVCLRIWDFVLTNDIFYIISIILALLETNQQTLLNIKELGELNEWFQNLNQMGVNPQLFQRSQFYKITQKQINHTAIEYCKIHPQNVLVHQLINYPYIKQFISEHIEYLPKIF